MILLAILAATLAAGIGSVWLAAALSFAMMGRFTQHLLSMAAGALLATAFMHLLPEALESQAGAQELFATLLVGVVFFFLLDKAELWHHGHEHHQGHGDHRHHDRREHVQGLAHGHGHDHNPDRDHDLAHDHGSAHRGHGRGSAAHRAQDAAAALHEHGAARVAAGPAAPSAPRAGGWAVLAGDSVQCFGDGILIASAFVAEPRLGVVAALAVLAHEVPHHMGDLVVLRETSGNRRAALVKVSLAGAVTALGGLAGWWLVDRLHDFLPYFLAVASSSFIYVALADLIPQLQKRLSLRQTAAQVLWLLIGIALVTLASRLAHAH